VIPPARSERNKTYIFIETIMGARVRSNDREQGWAALMRAGNAGDAAAYQQLLRELTPALRAAARRGLSAGGYAAMDAEDVVQETLLAIHLKRQTWDSGSPFSPWLWAIVRHKTIDVLRRRGRKIHVPIEDFAEVLGNEEAEPSMIVEDIDRHLKSLPDRQRNVVRAIAVDGASISEAADRLSMSAGAVRVALHRGLAALAAKFRMSEA
jgi:RNA polymerase sigma-70 factor, ECF subfamily